MQWLDTLKKFVEQRPLVIIRFGRNEWEKLYDSRRGFNEFTIARSHALFKGVKTPAPCLITEVDFGDETDFGAEAGAVHPENVPERPRVEFSKEWLEKTFVRAISGSELRW